LIALSVALVANLVAILAALNTLIVIDSKIVNKQIKCTVFPVLKEHGFAHFSSRSAWRYQADKVDVVNFQSFNSYLAEGVGCTTYSFALNLGCFFTYIPERFPTAQKDELKKPEESVCHFRSKLFRTFDQRELKRNDIWYIDPEGIYLKRCMEDALNQILIKGLVWFERFSKTEEVLRTLLEEEINMNGTWGFGRKPSPIRSYLAGYTALRLGDGNLANIKLQEAVESGSFKTLFANVQEAKNRFH